MKRLFKSRRTLSASSTSDVSVAAPRPRPTHKAVQSESDVKLHLGGVALATHARASANRLLELIGTLARTELWQHAEVLELYQRCSGYVGILEQEIARHNEALLRLRGLDWLHNHDPQPSALLNAQSSVLDDLRAAVPLLHSALEECAYRITDGNDPEIIRILDDCRVAYDRANHLRRELGKAGALPRENVKATKTALSGCLRSRDLLRNRLFLVQDSIVQQSLLQTVGMPELFSDGLITPEERVLEDIQAAISKIDGALADWMRPGPPIAPLSLELPARPIIHAPAPDLTFSAGSPASLLSSLPLTPGGFGGFSRSDGHGASPLIFTPATSNAPPTPGSGPFKFPLPPPVVLPPSRDEPLSISPSVGHGPRLNSEHGYRNPPAQIVPRTPNTIALCRRGALRRRQLSLPSIRESARIQSIVTPPPTLRPESTVSSNRRLTISSHRSSSLGDLSESLRVHGGESRNSVSTSQLVPGISAELLHAEPSPSAVSNSTRTSCAPSGSELTGGLTEVYDSYFVDSPMASGFAAQPSRPISSAPASASLSPPTNGEWLPLLTLENHPLGALDDLIDRPSSRDHDEDWHYSVRMGTLPNISVDTRPLGALGDLFSEGAPRSAPVAASRQAVTFEKAIARVTMLAAEMDIAVRRRSHLRSPAIGEGTSISLDDEWGFCRDLTDCIYDMAPRPQGFGGLSDVYSASWDSDGKTIKVAVKVVRTHGRKHEKTLRRLHREIKVWQKLDHPHVLPLYGVHFGMGDFPSLVSPWCEHGDINTYLSSRAGEPDLLNLKLLLLTQTLDGLQYLHSYTPEIVHGDLKGANILVCSSHKAQLCDFGFASMKADKSGSIFNSSAAKGTWRWMAPELLSDDSARHTKASDIWAYGCLLVEVLSGKVPYHEKVNDVPVIIAIARGEHPSRPADIHDALWDLMISCWKLDASERPPAEFIAQRLHHIRSHF